MQFASELVAIQRAAIVSGVNKSLQIEKVVMNLIDLTGANVNLLHQLNMAK